MSSLVESVYVSPDGEVLATSEVRPMFQSGISRYPLEKGKWYKVVTENIPVAPFSRDFVWINQYADDELFKAIPHNPQNFLTKSQWREKQIGELGL